MGSYVKPAKDPVNQTKNWYTIASWSGKVDNVSVKRRKDLCKAREYKDHLENSHKNTSDT